MIYLASTPGKSYTFFKVKRRLLCHRGHFISIVHTILFGQKRRWIESGIYEWNSSYIFLSNKRCIRMCHNIKNNSHEFVFLRAGSKSVNNILYYTLIYRKIRTLHIEVHLGFLSSSFKGKSISLELGKTCVFMYFRKQSLVKSKKSNSPVKWTSP